MTSFDGGADADFEPWPDWAAHGGSAGLGSDSSESGHAMPTAEDLEALRQAAFDEGFAAGHSEGLQRGADEARAQAQRLVSLIDSLARPLEQLDERVEQELKALVAAMVRQLVRREIKTEPGVIVATVREALAVLPLASREVAVKVHPDDAALLREVYSDAAEEGGRGWRIVETPAVTRGGCVVVTSTSEVDATVEKRLAIAIRHVLGGDRVEDTGSEQASNGVPARSEDMACQDAPSAGGGADSTQ